MSGFCLVWQLSLDIGLASPSIILINYTHIHVRNRHFSGQLPFFRIVIMFVVCFIIICSKTTPFFCIEHQCVPEMLMENPCNLIENLADILLSNEFIAVENSGIQSRNCLSRCHKCTPIVHAHCPI